MIRHNPRIVMYQEKDAFQSEDEFNPADSDGFMIAVGFIDFLSGVPRNDPRFVKWINFHQTYEAGKFVAKSAYNLHPCTEEDFKKFYPPEERAVKQVN